MRPLGLVVLALLALGACTIERAIPVDRFACANGGPCGSDASVPADGALDAAAADGAGEGDAALDAGAGADAEPTDLTAPRDASVDAGLPAPSCAVAVPLPPSGRVAADLAGAADHFQPSCGGQPAGPDLAYWFVVPTRLADLTVSTAGSRADTLLTLFRDDCAPSSELGCDDDGAISSFGAELTLSDVAPGAYYVVVDAWDAFSAGPFALSVRGRIATGERCDPATPFLTCRDGVCADDGTGGFACRAPRDCRDGIDVDGDGNVDEDAATCATPPAPTCPASITATVGATLVLTASVAAAMPLASARWSLVASPAVALPLLSAEEGSKTATLAVSIAGDYVLRFVAVDRAANAVACDTRVTVPPGPGLRVELFWLPPPRATDVDLDLHLLAPDAAAWFDPALDCGPESCALGLGWGGAGDPIHHGDALGRGPEVVTLDSPDLGATYRIGVYSAYGASPGSVAAFVRIHCDGALARGLGPTLLGAGALGDPDGTNAFWRVADVTFDEAGCVVTPLVDGAGLPEVVTSSTARAER